MAHLVWWWIHIVLMATCRYLCEITRRWWTINQLSAIGIVWVYWWGMQWIYDSLGWLEGTIRRLYAMVICRHLLINHASKIKSWPRNETIGIVLSDMRSINWLKGTFTGNHGLANWMWGGRMQSIVHLIEWIWICNATHHALPLESIHKTRKSLFSNGMIMIFRSRQKPCWDPATQTLDINRWW
jgi:hypothetical protein